MIHAILRRTLPSSVYIRLGLAGDAIDRVRFRPYVTTHTYGRRSLSVHVTDAMARGWHDHDWPLPGDLVGDTGCVVAVEATPHNAAVAWRNVALNGLTQVVVVYAAGADAPGVLRFSLRMNGYVAARDEASVQVRAITIDELTSAHGAPQVLFVDVEGYELHVLRGARRTLEAHHPDLFVEVHVGAGLERFGTTDDLLALIPSGYEILVSRSDRGPFLPLAVARDDLQHHSRLVALWPNATRAA
jgi:FkbM family methyltransferase